MNRNTLIAALMAAALLAPAGAIAQDAEPQIDTAPVEASEPAPSQEPPKLSWAQKAKLRMQITACRNEAGEEWGSSGKNTARNDRYDPINMKPATSLANTRWGKERREREAAQAAQAQPEPTQLIPGSRMSERCQRLVHDYEHIVFKSRRK